MLLLKHTIVKIKPLHFIGVNLVHQHFSAAIFCLLCFVGGYTCLKLHLITMALSSQHFLFIATRWNYCSLVMWLVQFAYEPLTWRFVSSSAVFSVGLLKAFKMAAFTLCKHQIQHKQAFAIKTATFKTIVQINNTMSYSPCVFP